MKPATRPVMTLAITLILTLMLAGCRHKPAPALVIPPPTPVPVTSPAPTAAKIPTIPTPAAPLTAVTVPAKKVRKPKKKTASIAQAQPLLVPAPAPPVVAPAAPALGALTLGESGSNARQEAESSITQLERRLAALPADLIKAQREQISRVEHFAEEAERALKGGDADGAQTLATKGKLILDDLLK